MGQQFGGQHGEPGTPLVPGIKKSHQHPDLMRAVGVRVCVAMAL